MTSKTSSTPPTPSTTSSNYLQPLSATLQQHGYPPEEATAAARTLLPDILHYDRTMPAHYPNGRVMTDDVFSARMIFMTHGQATPQAVKPHDDLLATFPFLGTTEPLTASQVFPRRRRDPSRRRHGPHRDHQIGRAWRARWRPNWPKRCASHQPRTMSAEVVPMSDIDRLPPSSLDLERKRGRA